MSLSTDTSQRWEGGSCFTCLNVASMSDNTPQKWESGLCSTCLTLSVMSLGADTPQRWESGPCFTWRDWGGDTLQRGESGPCFTCLNVVSLSADTPQRRKEVRDCSRCIPSTKTCSSSNWTPHSDSSFSVCGSVHSAWHSPLLARRLQ